MKDNDGKYLGIKQIPEVGDEIYIPSELSLNHGSDDIAGGKTTITRVEESISAGRPAIFVHIAASPGSSYNWQFMEGEQAELAALYGEQGAHAHPDDRAEFNPPNGGW